MATIRFTITVNASGEALTNEQLRRMYEKCHEAVSATVCYMKHARPKDQVKTISTETVSVVTGTENSDDVLYSN